MGGKKTADLLLRRGEDLAGNRIVEDSISVVPGVPTPYRYWSTLALSGSTATITELNGTWTGTGTVSGDSWKTQLKIGPNNYATSCTRTASALSCDTTVGPTTIKSEYTLLTAEECAAKFSTFGPPKGL
jgi:hypothetical protein